MQVFNSIAPGDLVKIKNTTSAWVLPPFSFCNGVFKGKYLESKKLIYTRQQPAPAVWQHSQFVPQYRNERAIIFFTNEESVVFNMDDTKYERQVEKNDFITLLNRYSFVDLYWTNRTLHDKRLNTLSKLVISSSQIQSQITAKRFVSALYRNEVVWFFDFADNDFVTYNIHDRREEYFCNVFTTNF